MNSAVASYHRREQGEYERKHGKEPSQPPLSDHGDSAPMFRPGEYRAIGEIDHPQAKRTNTD